MAGEDTVFGLDGMREGPICLSAFSNLSFLEAKNTFDGPAFIGE